MKKTTSFIFGALFAVSLVACGGSNSGQPTTPAAPAASPDGTAAPAADPAAPAADPAAAPPAK
jgi:hypothetical protein